MLAVCASGRAGQYRAWGKQKEKVLNSYDSEISVKLFQTVKNTMKTKQKKYQEGRKRHFDHLVLRTGKLKDSISSTASRKG